MPKINIYIGIDIGSTTVKVVIKDILNGEILWHDYQRHEAKQAEKVLAMLQKLEKEKPELRENEMRVFITGSGGKNISDIIGAKFVQEVNAVSLATEKLFPQVGAVIEIGGQDSKIIIFKDNPGGRKKKFPSMNDKCAGGTGSVIDKISAKLQIPPEELCKLEYDGLKIHHVAGKCGVFVETDINSLQKLGIPTEELMASLFDAIVVQNLTTLTRGHTMKPQVLLLGGPNAFIPGLQQAWRHHIHNLWADRGIEVPSDLGVEDGIIIPENALYFAALGSIEYGIEEPENVAIYQGWEKLEKYILHKSSRSKKDAVSGLITSKDELADFLNQYKPQVYTPPIFQKGQIVKAFIGLDGGSTSTKGVLLNINEDVIAKSYILSKGNPIEDSRLVIGNLSRQITDQGAYLEVLGLATTGYAKDILKEVLGADTAIVETVAHTASALHYNDQVDVICDVGGQDIKIMMLENGKVKDFKLNTQCSAGNGYFLQSTAEDFNIPVEEYADKAFKANMAPEFAYGCAVFLQSDIVNFQRQGWSPEEILAGLARVLPKNIWLYIAQIPNFSELGTTFLLQGGTQRNLAAVKAQVDFIRSRFEGKVEEPEIIVHPHCGESGAIGSALQDMKNWTKERKSEFIGVEALENIEYRSITNESTRCNFCKNRCLRTFIEINTCNSKNYRKLIVGHACEKGSVDNVNDMRQIQDRLEKTLKSTPNLAEENSKEVFESFAPKLIARGKMNPTFLNGINKKNKMLKDRASLKIGIPRVMLLYSYAPIFTSYFESLGIKKSNILFSDYTSNNLYRTGTNRGSIDPCFPSKVSIAHIHNLLEKHHKKRKLDLIFFPMISDQPKRFKTQGSWACPTIAGSAAVAKAAFTKEEDLFEIQGIKFLNTFLNLGEPEIFEKQMYVEFKDILGLNRSENRKAIKAGYDAYKQYIKKQQLKGKQILSQLEKQNKLGIVILGRPYHNDPGINHGIFKEFQHLNYPLLTLDALPMDEDILDSLFASDIEAGRISDPFDISDVWKNSMNENSNFKIWAAKFVARHPNLVALEISSFKCGHDAPTYSTIEKIIEQSGTPYFSFKDIDENKSTGSIQLRIETMDYFLKQYWTLKT